MLRILDAFEKLLRRSAYESITINDIVAESSTGAGSIYARFDGKRSILLAVHARVRSRARRYFLALFDPENHRDESVEAAIERIVTGMFAWHKRHRAVIKTSLLLDDPDIYQGISASFRPWNAQLAALLKARNPSMSESRAAIAAAAILQITTAVLQQRVIFGAVAPTGQELTEDELIAAMMAASLGQLDRYP